MSCRSRRAPARSSELARGREGLPTSSMSPPPRVTASAGQTGLPSRLPRRSRLPRHARWDGFFRRLAFVIVDECHTYRGVFGSHVAQVLRRLRRVAAHHAAPRSHGSGTYGSGTHGSRTHGPALVFVLASATISEPETCARLLTGLDAVAVTADSAPPGPPTLRPWDPPLPALRAEAAPPARPPPPTHPPP